MRLTAEAVRAFVVSELEAPLRRADVDPDELDDAFDLLTSGVVDSLGMLELIEAINERFGLDVDFEGLDPEEMTLLGPLARHVADSGASGSRAEPVT
jgi:acyl carrier protein